MSKKSAWQYRNHIAFVQLLAQCDYGDDNRIIAYARAHGIDITAQDILKPDMLLCKIANYVVSKDGQDDS